MKRNKCWLILLTLVVFVLTGCGGQITQGEVVEKNFTPAHSQVVMIPIVHSNGKMTYTTVVPMVYHYSDSYTITIEKWDAEDEEIKRATYRVNEEVYAAVSIGDEFSYEEDMKASEPEYTREEQHS